MKRNPQDTAEEKHEGEARDTAHATAFRLLGLAGQFASTGAAIAVLRPTARELRAAAAAGVTAALYDFFLESLGYENDLWYCYGGFQKVKIAGREFDFLHVPIEMVGGFFLSGIFFSLAADAPRLLRRRNPLLRPLLPPRRDRRWKRRFVLAAALSGAAGDFYSKKHGVWENGPGFTYLHCAFGAWMPLICLTLFTYDSLAKGNP